MKRGGGVGFEPVVGVEEVLDGSLVLVLGGCKGSVADRAPHGQSGADDEENCGHEGQKDRYGRGVDLRHDGSWLFPFSGQ